MPPCPDPPCLCSPALPSEGLCSCHSPVRHPPNYHPTPPTPFPTLFCGFTVKATAVAEHCSAWATSLPSPKPLTPPPPHQAFAGPLPRLGSRLAVGHCGTAVLVQWGNAGPLAKAGLCSLAHKLRTAAQPSKKCVFLLTNTMCHGQRGRRGGR